MMKKYSLIEIENYLKSFTTIEEARKSLSDNTIEESNLYYVYDTDAEWDVEVCSVKAFENWVRDFKIGPEQIKAYPAIKVDSDIRYNKNIDICLYEANHLLLNNIPKSCTHVVWFSK